MNTEITNLYTSPVAGQAEGLKDVSSTAVQCDLSGYDINVRIFDIQVQEDAVRVRFDGTAPTASVGFLFPVNSTASWSRSRLKAAKFIRVTTDAKIRFSPAASS